MIAVFGSTCDFFVFTPWTGLQVKQATSVIDNCITEQALNAALLIMRVNNALDKHNRKGRKKVLGQKSGPALTGPAGPPTMTLYTRRPLLLLKFDKRSHWNKKEFAT